MRTRLSVCVKKVSFESEADALAAAVRTGLPLRPYRCDRCHRVHLTSRTKGKRIPRPVGPGSSGPSSDGPLDRRAG